MTEKTKLQQISDLAFDIQHTNDPQVAFDKAGEILRLTELDQPAFKVGEYYSYNIMDDMLHILKITAVRGDKVDFTFLNTKSGSLVDMCKVKLDKRYIQPATAEQVAEFKRAEQFAKQGRKMDEEG